MRKKLILTLILFSLLYPAVAESGGDSTTLTCQECRQERQKLLDNISDLKQNISRLKAELEEYKNKTAYYKNQTEYYRQQYLSEDANLTNRRVKEIYGNITHIKNIINHNEENILDLDQQLDVVEKNVVYGIFIGGILGGLLGSLITFEVNILELLKKLFNRRKSRDGEEKDKEAS